MDFCFSVDLRFKLGQLKFFFLLITCLYQLLFDCCLCYQLQFSSRHTLIGRGLCIWKITNKSARPQTLFPLFSFEIFIYHSRGRLFTNSKTLKTPKIIFFWNPLKICTCWVLGYGNGKCNVLANDLNRKISIYFIYSLTIYIHKHTPCIPKIIQKFFTKNGTNPLKHSTKHLTLRSKKQ